ncbi:interferon-induced transmembrane protein 1-like [Lacerta agilis]|uniref:interferon-induced transmembrane protein 1-like n=1 Tax=Lacerta agilis TaxID=80427 RepID=UPI001419BED2|nr:interferon-induced transmembrane protein 1-like [Lacerta agilis]
MELESAIELRPYSVEMIGPETITICPYPFVVEQPKDHVLWSLWNYSFMNACCLGFGALVYSIKARDCKVAGNAEDATRYGKKAKIMNIVAMVLGILLFLLICGLIASVLIALQGRVKKLFDEYKANCLPCSFICQGMKPSAKQYYSHL